jgi:hypothetical protein
MKRVVIALDIQESLNTPEIITQNVNQLAAKYPVIATVMVADPDDLRNLEWLNIKSPNDDKSRIRTKYVYKRSTYMLPATILQTLKKNKIEEIFVVGGHTEAYLLSAGFQLFSAGFSKVSLIAPLVLTGQYHQHSVTMKIWEQSIGPVYETLPEANQS